MSDQSSPKPRWDAKRIAALAAVIAIGAAWFAMGYMLPAIGMFVCCVHLVFVFLDMGMNGAAGAEFVPFNFAGAALAGGGAFFGSP